MSLSEPNKAVVDHLLSVLYQDLGYILIAKSHATNAAKRMERYVDYLPTERALVLQQLGVVLCLLGQLGEARKATVQAVRLMTLGVGTRALPYAKALLRLAWVCREQNQHTLAERYCLGARLIIRNYSGGEDPGVLQALAAIARDRGDHLQARDLLSAAANCISEGSGGAEQWARWHGELAEVEFSLGYYREACQSYSMAQDLWLKTNPFSAPALTNLAGLAETLWRTGSVGLATDCYSQMKAISADRLGIHHWTTGASIVGVHLCKKEARPGNQWVTRGLSVGVE